MTTTVPPQHRAQLDYCFLLLTHIICADQQIHNQEAKALRELAAQAHVNEATLLEMEKILGQDASRLALKDVAQNVPVGQRSEAIRQVMAVAYVDGFFSPLEQAEVNRIAQLWGISQHEINQMRQEAQGFGHRQAETENKDELSVGARLLKGAESVLSKSLVNKLAELAPDHIGQQIERLQREILLSGPDYDTAIQHCANIANEDFKYAKEALSRTHDALKDLGLGIQQIIGDIKQKTTGDGEYQTAKEVATQLEQTRRELSARILHDLEAVREAFHSKQRALNHFSIAFMGRTKAGKSTLHAVITGEGWEAIGVGKQRTTRYNRVYEWKNIRIIDTPGIGAPGGKTDEEIARSVIEEADVICYVVTDDSIQEAEFAFLRSLKEKTKPLIILLNIQYNLRDSRRLEHFLKNPDRWFALEGKSGIGGHLNRIRRYAKDHYPNEHLPIIPVMLLAAQLSQEPEHEKQAKQLFQTSRIQDFLDSIRVSLIDYGKIRRSQTLLGSTVEHVTKPKKWIGQQADAYSNLVINLQEKRDSLKQQLQTAQLDHWELLHAEIGEIFKSAFDAIAPFAEKYWRSKQDVMSSGWEQKLKDLKFNERLEAVTKKASQEFQDDVKEAIEEIGNELELINKLQGNSFKFTEQGSHFFDKHLISIGGSILILAVSALLATVIAPAALVLSGFMAEGLKNWLKRKFKSKEQKRREAVQNISDSLRQQLKEQQDQVLQYANSEFSKQCHSITTAIDSYFEELIQALTKLASKFESAQKQLSEKEDYLNYAYAKRVVDWAIEEYEPLKNDFVIRKKIRRVSRDFGRSFQIQATTALSLTKSLGEICQVLQENVSIQPIKR